MTFSCATALCANVATRAKTSVIIAFPQRFIATLLHGSRSPQENCVNQMEFIFYWQLFVADGLLWGQSGLDIQQQPMGFGGFCPCAGRNSIHREQLVGNFSMGQRLLVSMLSLKRLSPEQVR